MSTQYKLRINRDFTMVVNAINSKMAKYQAITELNRKVELVQFLCTECDDLMPASEEDANWCQTCCDNDLVEIFETDCNVIMLPRYGIDCSDAGIDRNQLLEARNDEDADAFVERMAIKYEWRAI